MNKHIKRLLILVITVAAVVSTTLTSFAHETVSGKKHSSKYTGWDIYEDSAHWASYNVNMTVNNGIFNGTAFADYITYAVTNWNNARFNNQDLMTISESSTGVVRFRNKTTQNMVDEFGEVYRSCWGVVYRTNATIDENNHYELTSNNVEIWINWNDILSKKTGTSRTNCCRHTTQHEIGHVIGLKDVPESVSPNAYLMCNGFGQYYSVPTSITTNDLQGAAVILGRHSTHSSYSYVQYSANNHRKVCGICGAYTLHGHSISNGVCTKCGYSTS